MAWRTKKHWLQQPITSYIVPGKECDEICYDKQGDYVLDMQWPNKRIERWKEAVREKAKDAESTKHAMLYLRPDLVGFRAGMLAWFLYGCKKDRRTKELVSLFVIWVASYMLNSLLAYADQIETKGRKVYFAEAFASLPEQFNKEQLREALIAVGCKSPARQVVFHWQQQLLVNKIDKGLYRKVKHTD